MKIDYTRRQENRLPERQASVPVFILFVPYLIGVGLGYVTWDIAAEAFVIDYSFSWGRAIWRTFQYGIPVCLSMFSALGLVLIPMTAAARGYMLSIAAWVMYQSADLAEVLSVCILPALLQMTGLYYLMQFAQQTALDAVRRKAYIRTAMHRNKFLGVLFCYLLLSFCSAGLAVFFSEI